MTHPTFDVSRIRSGLVAFGSVRRNLLCSGVLLTLMLLSPQVRADFFPLELSGGTPILDDHFANLNGVTRECEAKTEIMQHAPGHLILGGPGAAGEKAGVRWDFSEVADFALLLEGMDWSHNNVEGGHPTEILMLDNAGNGYGMHLAGGKGELFRQDGSPEKRTMLAEKNLFSPDAFTVTRDLLLARQGNQIAFAFATDETSLLTAEDATYGHFTTLKMNYGVYVHGFRVLIRGILLKSLDTPSGAEPFATSNLLSGKRFAILNREENLPAIRRFGMAQKLTQAITSAGGEAQALSLDALQTIAATPWDAVIVPVSAIDAQTLPVLEQMLQNRIYLFLVGPVSFQETLKDADASTRALAHQLYERIWGNNAPPIKNELLDQGKISLTDFGRNVLGSDVPTGSIAQTQLLPLDNSIEKQTLPGFVVRENLLTVRYHAHNWVQLEDDFIGSVAQLQRHLGGEYAGARVLLATLPLDRATSPLAPGKPLLPALLQAALAVQPTPVAETELVADADVLSGNPELTRQNFYSYPNQIFGTLCFGNYSYLQDEVFRNDLNMGGFNVVCYCIPWLEPADESGEVINWRQLDEIMAQCKRMGKKVMLDPYPVTFNWQWFKWRKGRTNYNPAFQDLFNQEIQKVVNRYKDDDTLVAMWATSFSDDMTFTVLKEDDTPEIRTLYRNYLQQEKNYRTIAELNRRYGTTYQSFEEVDFPKATENLPFNLSPAWSDMIDFHIWGFQNAMRSTIRTIRNVIPDLPLTTRGNYLDVALSMEVASEFENVATHSECVETTSDTEGYYRSLARGFNIPITAENGWPKATPAAMRMALADYLMGDYKALTYSFDGPRWTRDVFAEFCDAARIRSQMNANQATYSAYAEVGLLIPDTTVYAGRPAHFSCLRGDRLEGVMEKTGYHFTGVSAQIPRFNDLKVLLEDGNNRVLSAAFRDQLIDWIKAGHCFVVHEKSCDYTLDGSANFFEVSGIPAKEGSYTLGSGRVIVRKTVEQDPSALAEFLRQLGLGSEVRLEPMVTNTVLTSADGQVHYLILFDKSETLVGSFFRESTHLATVAKMADKTLLISPRFPFESATELVTGTRLNVFQNQLTLPLPQTQFRVIEFR